MSHAAMQTLKLDWLSFTWGKGLYTDVESLLQGFYAAFPELALYPDQVIEQMSYVAGHYNAGLQYCLDFSVMWHSSRAEMAVRVDVPSHGLHNFANLFEGVAPDLEGVNEEDIDAERLLVELCKRGVNITRCDLAFDDYEKIFRPVDLLELMINWRIVAGTYNYSYNASDICGSDTFYLGSKKAGNEKLLRVYDKLAESQAKLWLLKKKGIDTSGFKIKDCIRWEYQLRDREARAVVQLICEGKFDFLGYLNSKIHIIEEDSAVESFRGKKLQELTDTQRQTLQQYRANADVWDKWEKFVSSHNLEKVKIEKAAKTDVAKKVEYFFDNLSVSFLRLVLAFGDNGVKPEDLYAFLVHNAADRIRRKGGKGFENEIKDYSKAIKLGNLKKGVVGYEKVASEFMLERLSKIVDTSLIIEE